ncbi:MAG: glycosyl hydrolase 53 family protein [Treponema sp.]|nr:glycosyl hydrolase 53 family protein [Treponema sp.]
MKRTDSFKALVIGFALFAFFGCDTPTNSANNAASVPNATTSDETPAADTSENTDTAAEREKKTIVEIDDDFVRGFDASYVDYYEHDLGNTYYDTDGTETDFFVILKNHAFDTVRLRIWVDPENAEENGIVSGDNSWARSGLNTLERTLRLARRAKDAGLKVLLDFHYSDYWADPGKQIIPYSWQSSTTANEMAQKLADYTKEVLTEMNDAGVSPEYVQVGNEIDSGMLLHTKYSGSVTLADEAVRGTSGSENFAAYLKAGCDAVREIAPDAKIILHVTNRKPTSVLTTSLSSQLDYDIVGLSYYPWESSHGTIESLRKNIKAFRSSDYGKEVMVVESSMYWNYGDWDENKRDLNLVAQHMVDPDTRSIYSDLSTKEVTYGGSTVTIVEGSIQNQANTFRHIMEEEADCGASGLFAWGGDMRGDWKYSFFDGNGKAFASIDALCLSVEISGDTSGTSESEEDEGTPEELPYTTSYRQAAH